MGDDCRRSTGENAVLFCSLFWYLSPSNRRTCIVMREDLIPLVLKIFDLLGIAFPRVVSM